MKKNLKYIKQSVKNVKQNCDTKENILNSYLVIFNMNKLIQILQYIYVTKCNTILCKYNELCSNSFYVLLIKYYCIGFSYIKLYKKVHKYCI